jgi:hypothetical protein
VGRALAFEASLNSSGEFWLWIPTVVSVMQEKINMIGRKAWIALAVSTGMIVLGAASAAASDHDRGESRDRGGSVQRCSLDGVNPVHHPEIFGNPAVALSYGFVLGPDRIWRVRANCRP